MLRRARRSSVIESCREYGEVEFTWLRLAVEPADFDRFDIIPLKAKEKDRRYKAFVEKYGTKCAEVEAIPAIDLRDRLRAAIESHIPAAQWERLLHIEETERFQWHEMMKKMGGAA